jgi:serine protease DegQ
MAGYRLVDWLVVAGVAAGSAAARAGLRPGDIVIVVKRGPMVSVEAMHDAVLEAGPVLALGLLRNNTKFFVIAR